MAAGDRMSQAEIIDRFGNVCYLCGDDIDVMLDNHHDPMYLNIDHIVPIARGGQHTWDNVAPTHKQCNESKGAKLVAPPVGWNGTWLRDCGEESGSSEADSEAGARSESHCGR